MKKVKKGEIMIIKDWADLHGISNDEYQIQIGLGECIDVFSIKTNFIATTLWTDELPTEEILDTLSIFGFNIEYAKRVDAVYKASSKIFKYPIDVEEENKMLREEIRILEEKARQHLLEIDTLTETIESMGKTLKKLENNCKETEEEKALTEEEYVFAVGLETVWYAWLARDSDNDVYAYSGEAPKKESNGFWVADMPCEISLMPSKCFKFIKKSDETPHSLAEMLEWEIKEER
jgi:hypothetical protein